MSTKFFMGISVIYTLFLMTGNNYFFDSYNISYYVTFPYNSVCTVCTWKKHIKTPVIFTFDTIILIIS